MTVRNFNGYFYFLVFLIAHTFDWTASFLVLLDKGKGLFGRLKRKAGLDLRVAECEISLVPIFPKWVLLIHGAVDTRFSWSEEVAAQIFLATVSGNLHRTLALLRSFGNLASITGVDGEEVLEILAPETVLPVSFLSGSRIQASCGRTIALVGRTVDQVGLLGLIVDEALEVK